MGDFCAINIFSKGINSMGTANIDALLASIADIKEKIRWREASLANVNPNYKMNAAYIARLTAEISSLKANLAADQAALNAASNPAKVKPTQANTSTLSGPINTTPYDDDGNLNPGWAINNETGEPYYIGQGAPISQPEVDPFETERLAAAERLNAQSPTAQEVINAEDDPFERERLEAAQRLTAQEQIDYNKPPTTEDPSNPSSANYVNSADAASDAAAAQRGYQEDQDYIASGGKGLSGKVNNTREQATTQDSVNFNQLPDWRVRIALAPNSPNVLYKAQPAGILQPLQATQGVIFPYTPSIQVNYVANYDPFDLVHSNYKAYQYKNSSVEQIQITGDFTAQDTYEASYLLAVIHFFRSVTKMFYGRDKNPKAGTPPPLCYIYGLGDFQFNAHPLAITSFNYSLPTEVDYIRAGTPTLVPGQPVTTTNNPNNSQTVSGNRMASNNLTPKTPAFQSPTNKEPTYVPTKMQISISAIPIVTRHDVSERFSVQDYATGGLLLGRTSKGGIW